MQTFPNTGSGAIVVAMAARIVENRSYLSEIDGKIGDGDHGVNMAKGFSMAADRLVAGETSLDEAFAILGDVLMSEIGGSMGPLYGMMFTEFAESLEGAETVDAARFSAMLHKGLDGVSSIGEAKVGDKTLMDAFVPAVAAFDEAERAGHPFPAALEAMAAAAERGRDSTIDLIAKLGRASRLGERSRGVLDAGATSCAMILGTLSEGAKARLTS